MRTSIIIFAAIAIYNRMLELGFSVVTAILGGIAIGLLMRYTLFGIKENSRSNKANGIPKHSL